MISVIVVFPKKEVALKIKNILIKNGYEVVATCLTGAQAMQAAERYEAGIVISGIRFVDMVYYELKDNLSDMYEMIVVANSRQWEQYGGDDVICLPLPMKAYDLMETVDDLAGEISRRLKRSRQKVKQRSAKEQGVINQAKEILMTNSGYTEEEAHRYLQKQSMDSGNNMVDTAYMLLEMFGQPIT